MKFALLTAATVAALTIGAGTASAQSRVLVPHGNHYHTVPVYPPVYNGYGYRTYSSGGFYTSPGFSFGFSSGFGSPSFGYGYSGGSWGGYHYGHHHNHYHHGHHHHR